MAIVPCRIRLEPTVDDPDSPPVYIDCPLDEFSKKIAGKQTLFGVYGDFKDKNAGFYPFTLDATGRVDFGQAYDGSDRYSECDLRDDAVTIGRLITATSPMYGTARFRVKEIFNLATRKSL
jgi:hypothetical protein